MKNIKFRSLILYVIIFAFFGGVGFFVYEFMTQSVQWAFSPVNRHLSEGSMSGGKILDSNNVVLAQTINGKRVYNENENIRKAMLHVVGDGSVLISNSVQSRYSTELFGYNPITGFGAPHVFDMNRNIKLTANSSVCASVSKNFKGKKGSAVAYNYLTGEILCMVSLPTYDVNNRPDFSNDSSGEYEGVYLNRAISSSYTPGSIFKIFTTAAALDLMSDAETRYFTCNQTEIIDGEKVTCMKNHGKINLINALSKSCDIAFCDIAVELGKEKMTSKMEEFGFNSPVCFENSQISTSVYDVKNASRADLGWSGIGQYTNRVNPLYMLRVMGAVANGGTPVEPYIVSSVFSEGSQIASSAKPNAGKRIMKQEIADKLKEMMRYTMKNQYGDSLFGGIPMCAKTGTAEVGEDKLPHGWMVGFSYDKTFPVAFAVIVENGDFGIKSAGPIASSMISALNADFKSKKYL